MIEVEDRDLAGLLLELFELGIDPVPLGRSGSSVYDALISAGHVQVGRNDLGAFVRLTRLGRRGASIRRGLLR